MTGGAIAGSGGPSPKRVPLKTAETGPALLCRHDSQRDGDRWRVGARPRGKPNRRAINSRRQILRVDFERDRIGAQSRAGAGSDAPPLPD